MLAALLPLRRADGTRSFINIEIKEDDPRVADLVSHGGSVGLRPGLFPQTPTPILLCL